MTTTQTNKNASPATQGQTPTLGPCFCKRGQQRDNCPQCEGTGMRIDFAAIRARKTSRKTVFNNDEVPHLWAHQTQEHARGAGSISFRGPTAYSYSMPVARHVTTKSGNPAVLFTTDGYSVTTSKHKRMFRDAIPPGVRVFTVDKVEINHPDQHKENVASYDARIARVNTDQQKRKPGSGIAQRLAEEVASMIAERNDYALSFGVRVQPIDAEKASKLAQRLANARKREIKAQQKREEARRAAQIAEWQEALPEWRAGQRQQMPWLDSAPVCLRAVGDELQTSKGARVPLAHAKLAVARIAKVRASGEAWHRNGSEIRVGAFHIDSIETTGDVKAGCHEIAWSEIETFAQSQGWL
jgi:hypothetical protein